MNHIERSSFFESFFESLGIHIIFFKETILWTFRPPFDRQNILAQMLEIGYKSLPVTTITLFFTGMVMALQIGKAMGCPHVRVLGIYRNRCNNLYVQGALPGFNSALLLAGRVGSSIAAEIGTMKVTEQIDALRTLSAEPVQYLSVPRFIACVVMTPSLTVITDIVGVLGGAVVAFIIIEYYS